MSGLRSPRSAPGSKAAGQGSTHTSVTKSRSAGGAKASGGPFSVSTHESLSPDRRAKPGAKASNAGHNSTVSQGQGVNDPHATAAEQVKPRGRAVPHAHGTEMVSEHHRR